jgi:uncharacterized membrane protein YbhN (UPF0104 family)
MIADVTKHKGHYSLLAGAAALYLGVVVKFQTTPTYLLVATAAFAAFYFIWGVFHHVATRSLHFKVVLEYFLVSALALIIISTVLV